MESVLQLLLEGLGYGEAAVDLCKERLLPLVERGLLRQEELEAIVADIRKGLCRRRDLLLRGARRELQRLLALLPLVPEDRFHELEARVRALEVDEGK